MTVQLSTDDLTILITALRRLEAAAQANGLPVTPFRCLLQRLHDAQTQTKHTTDTHNQ